MNSQDDSRLVQEVRKCPNLYDPRTQDYKDRTEKSSSWQEIGCVLGIKPEDAKSRWRNLRDRFVREKKLLVTDGEAAYSQRDPWPLLDDMSFLWDFITHRQERQSKLALNQVSEKSRPLKTARRQPETGQWGPQPILPRPSPEWVQIAWEYDTPTASPSQEEGPAEQACVIMDETEIKQDPSAAATYGPDDNDSPAKLELRLMTDKSNRSTQDESSEDMPRLSLAPEPHIQHLAEPMRDEDELFCLSVAGSLRRFPARKKALAKLWIQQVLFEVEFQSAPSLPAKSIYSA